MSVTGILSQLWIRKEVKRKAKTENTLERLGKMSRKKKERRGKQLEEKRNYEIHTRMHICICR